ncbi:MAG: hypothetical protein VYA08_01650, partial [Pseudomonadota bacterium]|nr:hypothetical protein [Pseudomonadota bacterium]
MVEISQQWASRYGYALCDNLTLLGLRSRSQHAQAGHPDFDITLADTQCPHRWNLSMPHQPPQT